MSLDAAENAVYIDLLHNQIKQLEVSLKQSHDINAVQLFNNRAQERKNRELRATIKRLNSENESLKTALNPEFLKLLKQLGKYFPNEDQI